MSHSPQVDAYIAKAAPFAQPILEYIREQVHAACPEVEESLKWNFPHFGYRGMLCGVAAFKAHCSFGFWKHRLLFGDARSGSDHGGMGDFGRLTHRDQLPDAKILRALIKKAMALNEGGAEAPKRPVKRKPAPVSPPDLLAALKKSTAAARVFRDFSNTNQREYIEWLEEAKTAATREKRLTQAIEWIAEGKSRNWKYMTKKA